MYCPLMGLRQPESVVDCYMEYCGMWDRIHGTCAVVSIAHALNNGIKVWTYGDR